MKNFLGYLAIGLVKILSFVTLKRAQNLGEKIGSFLYNRKTRSREVARTNVSIVYPNLSGEQKEKFLKQTLIENGKTIAETGPMWGYEPSETAKLVREVHGQALFDELMQHDGGKVLLAPHLGNWEIINHFVASHNHDITIMYRPAKWKSFNSWMVNRRETIGCKLVPTTREGVMGLFKSLKRGELVGFLPDQEPRLKSGVFADFMGHPTLTPKLPHEMLVKTGSKALFAFAKRLPDAQGFAMHFVEADDDLYSDDATVSATSMNRSIERCIQLCPEQYQWTYKRFKRQPEGKANPYNTAKIK